MRFFKTFRMPMGKRHGHAFKRVLRLATPALQNIEC